MSILRQGLLLYLALIFCLSACGQKGDLFLPQDPKESTAADPTQKFNREADAAFY